MTNIFNYIDRSSPIHRLTGATKLVCLLLWSFAAMSSFDTRLLAGLAVLALSLFRVSRIRLKDVRFMLWFTFAFCVMNNVLIFLFSPQHGVELYGARHVLFEIAGNYVVTKEQLFYHLNVFLKYLSTIPIVLLFVSTTDPSEFAASLNRIGVSYKIAYAVALALRYIPDVQREYHDISLSLQARGVELSKKERLSKRLKSAAGTLTPLILSSMDRIEIVSNAMELRGFGKNKKRTWYRARPFRTADWVSMAACAALLLLSVALTLFVNSGRYYNPFV
ncbi:MAG: energy-coupling factor transporter transmembrane component T [Oscillospiraceae bacterium]|nr:energy-coupling factor transporter transmembrane component T [Oscillospiraceae bacterium]